MFRFRKGKANPIDTIKDDIKQKFAKSLDEVVPDPETSEVPHWSDSGNPIEEFKQQYIMLVDNMLDRVDNAKWYDNAYSLTASADALVRDHQMSRKDVMKALYYYSQESAKGSIPKGNYTQEEWNGRGNITQRGSRALFNSLKHLAEIDMGEKLKTDESLETKVDALNGDFEKLFVAVGEKFYNEDSNFPGKPSKAKGGKKTRKHKKSKKARKSHKKRNKSHRKK